MMARNSSGVRGHTVLQSSARADLQRFGASCKRCSCEGEWHASLRNTERNQSPGHAVFSLPGPWSPLRQSLSQAKISLVTSAGLHLRDDKPFIGDPKGGDTSYRVIPSTAKAADILQSHVSIGFDHTAIMRDLNVTLPIDRVRELVDKGIVGSLAENYYSFMGALRNPKPLIEATGPEVASRLKDEGVGLVLITPT
jgi:D-proline reductase (dithiol) PrdB